MMLPTRTADQVRTVSTFHDLVTIPFEGVVNAACWNRELQGDFSEIVAKVELKENMANLSEDELRALDLTEQGALAREVLLGDMELLTAHGASPVLNLIEYYERDDAYPAFPTDVYSYHVDRSPVPTDTFLCTYHGASSDILPNAHGEQKILVPEIRNELMTLYDGPGEGFDAFLSEFFFDLHYRARPGARPISLGRGHLWRLAVDHPESQVPPCLHRAPAQIDKEVRLMLIC